jgi:hypothetical protein
MDLQLDRKIFLTTEREHKSLYSWCIQENDTNGEKIGQDQIPWAWNNHFVATNLYYHLNLTGKTKGSSNLKFLDDTRKEPSKNKQKSIDKQIVIDEGDSITAILHSENDETSYSMFGTDRQIKDIRLQISKESGKTKEFCYAWGCPSYETEHDFSNITEPDIIQFYLTLKAEKFNKILELIKTNNINKLKFIASGVTGFYSEWSPSISASKIKVLTNDSYHKVEIDEKCKMTPTQLQNIPRIGEVLEFNLWITKNQGEQLISLNNDDADEDNNYIETSEKFSGQINFNKNLIIQLQKVAHPIKQTLLVIAILLVLILIFK